MLKLASLYKNNNTRSVLLGNLIYARVGMVCITCVIKEQVSCHTQLAVNFKSMPCVYTSSKIKSELRSKRKSALQLMLWYNISVLTCLIQLVFGDRSPPKFANLTVSKTKNFFF